MTTTSGAPGDVDASVIDNGAASRFEARIDGQLAGFVTYALQPGRIEFRHTEVLPEFEGKGVGGKLAAYALDDARSRGLEVVPSCPFFAAYIQRHSQYTDLVAPGS